MNAFADDFYSKHESGWFWFDDPSEQKIEKESKVSSVDPSQKVNEIQKTIKRSLDLAILDPTPENIANYITLQNQMSARASQFTNAWKEVILNRPDLNYSITHPTNNVGLQVYHENESKEKEGVLNQFAQRSGLFFFYRSTCPYCQRFAPILKHFSEAHHIVVIPITTDGIPLPEFPDSKRDMGQSQKFHVTVEPSLYAVDPTNHKAYPIAFGLVSETELENNIYNIMTKYQEGIS